MGCGCQIDKTTATSSWCHEHLLLWQGATKATSWPPISYDVQNYMDGVSESVPALVNERFVYSASSPLNLYNGNTFRKRS